jgi:alkylated DNA repair dioxygenase AlkB
MGAIRAPLQRSLLATGPVAVDPTFRHAARRELGDGAWVDHVPGWCSGSEELFEELEWSVAWEHHVVPMYERMVDQPRLTAGWAVGSAADPTAPVPHPVLVDAAEAIGDRYGFVVGRIGANLYRDGADSVAWHGDRVARELPEAVVAVLSLGSPRAFRLRPAGGGPSTSYHPAPGDLLVMGGTCQRTWQHSVPKARHGGPRISVTFRESYG